MITNYLGNEQTIFTLTTGKEFVLTNSELDELLTTNDKYMELINECKRLEQENKDLEQENDDLQSYKNDNWELDNKCNKLKDELDIFHKQGFIFENCKSYDFNFTNNDYKFTIKDGKNFTNKNYINLIEQVYKYLKEKK